MLLRKLPRRKRQFYEQIARMLKKIISNLSTVKTEVYKSNTPLRYYPLLHKVVLNYKLLEELATKAGLVNDGKEIGVILACEILTDNYLNDGYKRKLKALIGIQKLKEIEKKVYIRINTLKATLETLREYNIMDTCVPGVFQMVDTVDNDGFVNECDDKSSIFPDSENREKLGGLKKSLADFYRDSELQSKIKIQSLASCLPAFILNPPEGSVVIDAAAAPGNKTTHLCSIMNNTGQIYAFEKDERRFKTLEEQLIKYGTTNVTPKNMDFLKVNPEEYKVDYILLDPSCSGSGIHLNYTKDNKRIEKLHNIQAMLLNHALKFSPKKVVYSTCSVHAEEGEDVVKEVLEKNPNYEVEHIGDFWQDRGLSGYEFSNDVIRSQRSDDSDVGFFVVLLRLKDESQR